MITMPMTVSAWPTRLSLAVLVLGALAPCAARADFHIRSPDEIDYQEWEFETNGAASFDHNPFNSGETSYTLEIGRGVNSWWHPELELDIGRNAGPDQPTQIQGLTWENTFALTEPGEYWLDFGLYWEYSLSTQQGSPDDTLFGALLQKDWGPTTHTLNLFLDKEIGPNQDRNGLEFTYAWQSRWNLNRYASPAIEIYGDAGQIDRLEKFQDQELRIGPVLLGSVPTGTSGQFKYELGWLFGATRATPQGTLRWKLEWEAHF
jgi:hypothetical protein